MSSFLKRWWWALLLVAVCLGLWRLRFDVDILDLLPPDEPTVQGLKLYQQHFANARELIITLRAPDAEQAERLAGELADRLRQQTNLVAEVTWQAPWMEHPEQLGELLGWLWFNQPPESFGALTNRLAPGPAQARAGADQGSARHFHVADGPGPARVRSVRFADDAGADQSRRLLQRTRASRCLPRPTESSVCCMWNPPWIWAVTARARAG